MSNQIVVVGSINLDMVAAVEHLPLPGETLSASDFQTYCGGKGANQAVAAARLGASVSLIGKVGDDSFGDHLRSGLKKAGVKLGCLQKIPGSSGIALIATNPAGENSIIVVGGANQELLSPDLDRYRSEIVHAAIVLTQLETPLSTVEYLGTISQSAGIPFVLDPAPACALSTKLLQTVTWLTPNESEAQQLLGESPEDLDEAKAAVTADRLLKLGVRNVALKLGSKGVYLSGRDISPRHIPGYQVLAVDTTGAGDAFNGAFAYALGIQGVNPSAAASFACGVAALSVTKHGAQTSMPTIEQYEQFMNEQNHVQFSTARSG